MKRITREKDTVAKMIRIYCRAHHGRNLATKMETESLCPECENLRSYSHARLSHCPFGEKKTTCKRCAIHCYKPEMREKMRCVMRYAGPRMIFHAPLAAIKHLIEK